MFKNNCITVLILVVISFSGCIDFSNGPELVNGITTFEAFEIANANFFDNNTDAIIFKVIGGDTTNGFFNYVLFLFTETNEHNESVTSRYYIYSNNSYKYAHYNKDFWPEFISIINWTIDSDEAYNIAINNTEVSDYLNISRSNSKIDSFVLRTGSGYVENRTAVWHILWRNMGYLGFGQSHIKIEIDASTGEVLYTGPTR